MCGQNRIPKFLKNWENYINLPISKLTCYKTLVLETVQYRCKWTHTDQWTESKVQKQMLNIRLFFSKETRQFIEGRICLFNKIALEQLYICTEKDDLRCWPQKKSLKMNHRLKRKVWYKLLQESTEPLPDLGLGKDFVNNYTERMEN